MPDSAPATAGPATRAPGVVVSAQARGVPLRYGSNPPVLTDIDLEVVPGEALAVIGPNGAGKSTFILGLLGLTTLDAGDLRCWHRTRRSPQRVGFVPQTAGLDPDFPVTLDQVVMMGRYRKLGRAGPAAPIGMRCAPPCAASASEAQRRTRFGRLSGGQQQRGLLARALVSDPRLLVLDEPFNGLDQTNRDTLLQIVRELKTDGVAFVISTHDLDLARAVCDTVLLVNGTQIAVGPRDDVLTLENLELSSPATRSSSMSTPSWCRPTTATPERRLAIDFLFGPFALPFMAAAASRHARLRRRARAASVMVTLRSLQFVGDGLVHAVFPGIVIGFAMGARGPGAGWSHRGGPRGGRLHFPRPSALASDSAIAVVLTVMFGIGVIIVSHQSDYVGQLQDCCLADSSP